MNVHYPSSSLKAEFRLLHAVGWQCSWAPCTETPSWTLRQPQAPCSLPLATCTCGLSNTSGIHSLFGAYASCTTLTTHSSLV